MLFTAPTSLQILFSKKAVSSALPSLASTIPACTSAPSSARQQLLRRRCHRLQLMEIRRGSACHTLRWRRELGSHFSRVSLLMIVICVFHVALLMIVKCVLTSLRATYQHNGVYLHFYVSGFSSVLKRAPLHQLILERTYHLTNSGGGFMATLWLCLLRWRW